MLPNNGRKTYKLLAVKIFLAHINSGYLMIVIGGVVVNSLVGVAAACVKGYLKFAAYVAAASLLVYRAEYMEELAYALLLGVSRNGIGSYKGNSYKS